MNYNFLHNIEVILRDDNLEYKAQNRNYHLFDFDNYLPNDSQKYEKAVKEN